MHGIEFGSDLTEAACVLAEGERLSIEFSIADAEALPFDDASFDVVTSAS